MSYGPIEKLVIDHLDVDACTALLARGGIGRVGFVSGDDVMVLPVNFVFDRGSVLFRTAPGAKFEAALHRSRVGFEIDGAEPGGAHWSVLVNGVAQEVWDPLELRRIARLPLWSLTNRNHGSVVQIAPASISGRRYRHVPATSTVWIEDAPQEVES